MPTVTQKTPSSHLKQKKKNIIKKKLLFGYFQTTFPTIYATGCYTAFSFFITYIFTCEMMLKHKQDKKKQDKMLMTGMETRLTDKNKTFMALT